MVKMLMMLMLMMMLLMLMMLIYILWWTVCVCLSRKSSLPTSELSAGGAKWAARYAGFGLVMLMMLMMLMMLLILMKIIRRAPSSDADMVASWLTTWLLFWQVVWFRKYSFEVVQINIKLWHKYSNSFNLSTTQLSNSFIVGRLDLR